MGWETVRQALVLINSEPGAEATVLKALEAIPEVKEAHMIYGVYDIIAQVCARDFVYPQSLTMEYHHSPNLLS